MLDFVMRNGTVVLTRWDYDLKRLNAMIYTRRAIEESERQGETALTPRNVRRAARAKRKGRDR